MNLRMSAQIVCISQKKKYDNLRILKKKRKKIVCIDCCLRVFLISSDILIKIFFCSNFIALNNYFNENMFPTWIVKFPISSIYFFKFSISKIQSYNV